MLQPSTWPACPASKAPKARISSPQGASDLPLAIIRRHALIVLQIYAREELGARKEQYRLIGNFEEQPMATQITQCFKEQT